MDPKSGSRGEADAETHNDIDTVHGKSSDCLQSKENADGRQDTKVDTADTKAPAPLKFDSLEAAKEAVYTNRKEQFTSERAYKTHRHETLLKQAKQSEEDAREQALRASEDMEQSASRYFKALKHNLEKRFEADLHDQLRADVIRDWREYTEPELKASLRGKTEEALRDELTPLVEAKLAKDLYQSVKEELQKELRPIVEAQLLAELRAEKAPNTPRTAPEHEETVDQGAKASLKRAHDDSDGEDSEKQYKRAKGEDATLKRDHEEEEDEEEAGDRREGAKYDTEDAPGEEEDEDAEYEELPREAQVYQEDGEEAYEEHYEGQEIYEEESEEEQESSEEEDHIKKIQPSENSESDDEVPTARMQEAQRPMIPASNTQDTAYVIDDSDEEDDADKTLVAETTEVSPLGNSILIKKGHLVSDEEEIAEV